MMLIKTQEALLSAFRPRDRRRVELAPELRFPLEVGDYLAWTDASGGRVYLVIQDERSGRPLGIAFRGSAGSGEGPGPLMCDWCHSAGSRMDIGLLTAEMSSKRRLGVELCLDLRCGEKIKEQAERSGSSGREPLRRLLARMSRFAREGLGIEQVPDDVGGDQAG